MTWSLCCAGPSWLSFSWKHFQVWRFLRCHVLLVFPHLLGCSFSSFLLFPLFSLISKYCYVPDLPSSTTHSLPWQSHPASCFYIYPHANNFHAISQNSRHTSTWRSKCVFQRWCFKLNFSQLLHFTNLDHPQSYLPQLMATPFLQMPRLKIIRAILDASVIPSHSNPVGCVQSIQFLTSWQHPSPYHRHFSPRLLLPLLSWPPHCPTCPLTQASQNPKQPVTSLKKMWKPPYSSQEAVHVGHIPLRYLPDPSARRVSFLYPVLVTLISHYPWTTASRFPPLDLCIASPLRL